jgi:glycerate dehydrogenase
MNKPSAIFLDKASVYPGDLDFSALEAAASWQWFDNVTPGEIRHSLLDAEILVSNKVVINSQLIADCRRLKLICVAATGVNNIDLVAARQRGINVCNVRAYATSSVVQHVFSLILALNRKLFSYKRSVTTGDWSHSEFFCYFGEPISELQGKTIGIIGYGELGRAVAKVARCFGMKVIIARRHAAGARQGPGSDPGPEDGRVDMDVLLSQADVLTLHCPLTEDNRHLLGEGEFARMKPDAILLNTARGGLVDEAALLHALETKQIGAAALDVLEEEPPAIDNVLSNYQADNLIITPHIAWASRESRQRLLDEIAENIMAYRQGIARNIV